jgi:hypothetical protein
VPWDPSFSLKDLIDAVEARIPAGRVAVTVLLALAIVALLVLLVRFIWEEALVPLANFANAALSGHISAPTVSGAAFGTVTALVVFWLMMRISEKMLEAMRLTAKAQKSQTEASQGILEYAKRLDQRVAALEGGSGGVPHLRPRIVPVKWGGSPGERHGLIVRNDGEPAFDISVDEPVAVGSSMVDFWSRTYPGLTRADGELVIDAHIRQNTGGGTFGSALRDEMVKAGVESIPLKVRYRDLDGRQYISTCEVVREIWDGGLRVASVNQQLVTAAGA